MKISIVTPCLNAEKTIRKTVESVVQEKQTNEIEYIVIDGKSSDSTVEILKEYSEYLDYFCSEKDTGVYEAFNKGVEIATGEYVLILAADDYLLRGAISDFKESVLPDTDVWAGSLVYYKNGYYQYMFSNPDLLQLYNTCSVRHPAVFFKKGVHRKYGFYDSTYKVAGDREFFLRLLEQGARFQIEKTPIVFFSTGGLSNSADWISQSAFEEERIAKQYPSNQITASRQHVNNCLSRVKDLAIGVMIRIGVYKSVSELIGHGEKFVDPEVLQKLR